MAKSFIKKDVIGSWAFLIGVILAVVFGLISAGSLNKTVAMVLVIIGLVVGFLNVTEKESTKFLIASIALLRIFKNTCWIWEGSDTAFGRFSERLRRTVIR